MFRHLSDRYNFRADTGVTVTPNSQVYISQDVEPIDLLIAALDNEDHRRRELIVCLNLIDPDRTAKLAQFELEMRQAEHRI